MILSHHEEGEVYHNQNPFIGFPTPEKDAAWMQLMDGGHKQTFPRTITKFEAGYAIRVPAGSVEAVGLESIPLNDESGDVWVSMNIYHHLHCLVSS